MNLLVSSGSKISKDKNDENVPNLQVTQVILVHCSIVDNDYKYDSRILYTFVPNKPFSSLLKISRTNHIFLKTFNSKYNKIKIWFTDQNIQLLQIEDRLNLNW